MFVRLEQVVVQCGDSLEIHRRGGRIDAHRLNEQIMVPLQSCLHYHIVDRRVRTAEDPQRLGKIARGNGDDPLQTDKGCRFNLHPFRCSGVFTG